MVRQTDTFWNEYTRVVAKILTPLTDRERLPEQEILDAEARLGIRLPTLLREFYLRVGSRADINQPHDTLILPNELTLQDHVLVFYDTHQSVVLYGIDLRSADYDDPTVVYAENDEDATDRLDWDVWHQTLSGFLMQELFWQAVNGGMPQVGIGVISGEESPEVPDGWESKIVDGDLQNGFALFRVGQALLVWGTYPAPDISAGARTKKDLRAIGKTFDVAWDYANLGAPLIQRL